MGTDRSIERVGDAIVAESKTAFRILFDENHPLADNLRSFFSRFFGTWERAENVERATILILLALPDSRFDNAAVQHAEEIFARDGTEANVYEFDKFSNQLRALRMETIRSRAIEK